MQYNFYVLMNSFFIESLQWISFLMILCSQDIFITIIYDINRNSCKIQITQEIMNYT